ncbi:MAG: hypothetical protein KDC54_18040 [Lewinella sp.]|nr:hypothetical protein [Lewinella sp.]
MLRTILLFGLLANASTLAGQSPVINLSYFGVLGTHPGLKIGLAWPVASWPGEDGDAGLSQLIAGPSLIVYFHRRNHLGLGLQAELGFRHRRPAGFQLETMAGVGVLRAWRPERMYDFDRAADGPPRHWSGQSFFLKTVSLGLGGRVGNRHGDDRWLLKPTLLHTRPYATASHFNIAIDAAFQFQ